MASASLPPSLVAPPPTSPSPPPAAGIGTIPMPLSFAAAVSRPRIHPRFPPLNLTSKNLRFKDGKPAVSFSSAKFLAGAKRFNFSLVAKFTVGRPAIPVIQRAFQSSWTLEGRATISEIWDGRHILIILDSERDVKAALASPLRKIGHSLFRLFRWHPDFNPRKEATSTTAWLRLPDLPLPLYDSSFIEIIVSTFGTFLDVDERTKACLSLKHARACVEIDVTKPIPDEVWVNLPNDKGFWQKIVLERKPYGWLMPDWLRRRSMLSKLHPQTSMLAKF